MKIKIFSLALVLCLLGSLLNPGVVNAVVTPSDDQNCAIAYPYTYESSDSIASNGSLVQTFVPTQNRMRYLFINMFVYNATQTGPVYIEILDNNDSVIYSTSVNVGPDMNGEGVIYTIDFWQLGQPYDIHLTPGETHRIKLTSPNPFAGAYWPNSYDGSGNNCNPIGAGYKAGVMQNYDYGYTTRGYVNPASIYRFWSDTYHGHFYTSSVAEKNFLIENDPNWSYEGESFKTYDFALEGTSPVYRFWSNNYKHHFFTISESEKNLIIANDPNWAYEGIAYYTHSSSQPNTSALYRFWSNKYSGHFYTSSVSEKDNVIANMPEWNYEGVAYFLPN